MAQAKDTTKDSAATEPGERGAGRPMPEGTKPIEYRPKPGVNLAIAGRVVKEAWVGAVCGRSVRVYRGAPESALPGAVKGAITEAGIEIGLVTLEELGLRPRETGIVNLTRPSFNQG